MEEFVNVEKVWQEITSVNNAARDSFVEHFEIQLWELSSALSNLINIVEEQRKNRNDERSEIVHLFLFGATNCIFSATQLLVFGYILPAGNLMRSWHEAVIMAILTSSRIVGVFEKYNRNRGNFPIHSVIKTLNPKTMQMLNINEKTFKKFKNSYEHYHDSSHSSFFALSSLLSFSDNILALGGYFDKAKISAYAFELKNLEGLCKWTIDVIPTIKLNLERSKS